ncbi:MAG: hypothetical protein ACLP19_08475 [Xanthobacteraceae bacterium]
MDALESADGSFRYLEPQGSLKPANAAVALIVDEEGRYLVQLRDAKPTIFFPDHWAASAARSSLGRPTGAVSSARSTKSSGLTCGHAQCATSRRSRSTSALPAAP